MTGSLVDIQAPGKQRKETESKLSMPWNRVVREFQSGDGLSFRFKNTDFCDLGSLSNISTGLPKVP